VPSYEHSKGGLTSATRSWTSLAVEPSAVP